MPKAIRLYVKYVDAVNAAVGRFALYLVFAIMGVLLISTASRYVLNRPVIWGVEMAQFVMTIYYVLGGGFALLLNSHARMDVIYAKWGFKKRAKADLITFICLITYLGLLLYGSLSSTAYSLEYNQHNNTAWGPPVAPIKIILVLGIFLTFLQAFSEFFKDWAKAKGITLGKDLPEKFLLESNSSDKITAEPQTVQPLEILKQAA
jgi:TRAP-type mannitol/chloroaromatic compound transport system permease small subunit